MSSVTAVRGDSSNKDSTKQSSVGGPETSLRHQWENHTPASLWSYTLLPNINRLLTHIIQDKTSNTYFLQRVLRLILHLAPPYTRLHRRTPAYIRTASGGNTIDPNTIG